MNQNGECDCAVTFSSAKHSTNRAKTGDNLLHLIAQAHTGVEATDGKVVHWLERVSDTQ